MASDASESWQLKAVSAGWGPVKDRDERLQRLDAERRAFWIELEKERERHGALLRRLREETSKRPMLLPGSPKLIDELVAHLEKAEADLRKCRELVYKWRAEADNHSSPMSTGFQTRFILRKNASELQEALP